MSAADLQALMECSDFIKEGFFEMIINYYIIFYLL